MTDYLYFRAAGRSLEAVAEWRRQTIDAERRAQELSSEIGAERHARTTHVIGFAFPDDKPPEGWEQTMSLGRRPVFAPAKHLHGRRALWSRMQAITYPNGQTFEFLLGGGGAITAANGNIYEFPTFENVAGAVFIRTPDTLDNRTHPPADCIPVRTWEYWFLKESEVRVHLASQRPYRVLTMGKVEADLTPVTIYMGEDGIVWTRPTAEFEDGRFGPAAVLQ